MRPMKKIKIAIVGAGGKIGKRVLEALWGQASEFPNIEQVVALNTLPRNIFGFFLDYSVANPKKCLEILGNRL